MKTQSFADRRGPAAFERLESRFLLDAAPLGEPEVCDGRDEAAATPAVVEVPADPCVWEPVCGVDGGSYGSSSCGLAGRGPDTADLGEGLYRPDSRDIDTLSSGAGDQTPFSGAQAYLRGRVVDLSGNAAGAVPPGVTVTAAPEPTRATFNGRGIALNADAKIDSLGGAPTADMPVVPQERPILEVVLGSTGDYQYGGGKQGPVLPQDGMCVCPHNLIAIAEVAGLSGGAGHCKIMAVRVANPESSGGGGGPLGMLAGGPLGALMG